MPITIAGSGTIGGISVGGLPDNSIVTADIADANITAAKLSGAQSGSAPIYAARAWVNFNGTGTVAIRASGNVSSITDHAVGDYTVNFTTALANANYCYVVSSGQGNVLMTGNQAGAVPTTSALRVSTLIGNTGGVIDTARLNVTIFL